LVRVVTIYINFSDLHTFCFVDVHYYSHRYTMGSVNNTVNILRCL
jgi:hypothetical protein